MSADIDFLPARPHRVVVLALDGVYPFELGIPNRVFTCVPGAYDVVTCAASEDRTVTTNADFTVTVGHGPEALESADTVVVPPYDMARIAQELSGPDAAALARIQPGTRIVSICTGAFALAAAGMLDGRPATTHWALAPRFRRMFPQVALDPDVLFIDDGDVLTSAGAASGVDVCLHVVRSDHGSAVANSVARQCVVPPWRDGGQAQYIELPVPDEGATGTAATRAWALENLERPLALQELADHARMSRRTFARRFQEETGTSPGRWLIQQRVRRARDLLETSELSVDRIAAEVGFATGTSLRQHLHAAIGVSPQAYRNTFRATAAGRV
ncbi:GlxA family transcriptional regulator [Streptomyces sp. Ag109_O5-10]|uniref:GlxA family transcriptional regulator n=1 Tax=Streptomyces sp. Ag109_O5-10 TaxID=1855349 RepID=UPI000897C182|nr:helix-turn-helix domain-containing protein [Streptomyces sp. Ag109_O5-10]SEF07623.1 Transcriptional regulator GlxA family, contains an amidase domain and an AraC-type DNA-binding HTH domain [Streptomyces sp. Ag109_O5-10]